MKIVFALLLAASLMTCAAAQPKGKPRVPRSDSTTNLNQYRGTAEGLLPDKAGQYIKHPPERDRSSRVSERLKATSALQAIYTYERLYTLEVTVAVFSSEKEAQAALEAIRSGDFRQGSRKWIEGARGNKVKGGRRVGERYVMRGRSASFDYDDRVIILWRNGVAIFNVSARGNGSNNLTGALEFEKAFPY